MTTKTEKRKSFATKTEKTDLKLNSQNRKTENPNAPLLKVFLEKISWRSFNSSYMTVMY